MAVSALTSSSSRVAVRDRFLSTMAVLFGLLALSDFTKAAQRMQDPAHAGLVILGTKLTSIGANLIGGLVLGVFLAAYAAGLWRRRRWVLPISLLYAFYVPFNLVLFWFGNLGPRPPLNFIIFYLIVSVGGSVGTALYLAWHREQLE